MRLRARPTETLVWPNAAAAGTAQVGDLAINRLGFGAMRITGPGIWGPPRDEDESRRLLRRAVELEINFIDTAYAYGPEVSERLIAEALHPYPPGLVIATKSGQQRTGPDRWYPDGRPATLRRELHRSLELLRLDCIDLFQLHRPDPAVSIEESVGELALLQRGGKIRHIGVCTVDLDQLRRAQSVATIVSVQNRYGFLDRSSEAVLATCTSQGIVFIPWYPLGAGEAAEHPALRDTAQLLQISQVQLALAWLLAHSPVTLPIPGTSSVVHLEENVAAAAVELTSDELLRLADRRRWATEPR